MARQYHPISHSFKRQKFFPQLRRQSHFSNMNQSRSHAKDFSGFFVFLVEHFPATLQYVAYGPVVEVSGGHFCFVAFLLFFLFSARKSKNKGTPRHHNIDPFDAFHRLSPSHVQPVASQRFNLKPQEKPNWPPTSKRAALRSHHMRQQGPEQFQTPFPASSFLDCPLVGAVQE